MRLIVAILSILFVVWTFPLLLAGVFMFVQFHQFY